MHEAPEQSRPAAILIVDDEALVRMVTADILADAGYRVIEAVNTREALALLELRPDIRALVTDVNMPGSLDGFALARIVDLRWPGVWVIVSSGGVRPSPGDLPRRARFLAKPYPPSVLVGLVRDLLDPGAAPGAAASRGFDGVVIDSLLQRDATVMAPAAPEGARIEIPTAVAPEPVFPPLMAQAMADFGEDAALPPDSDKV